MKIDIEQVILNINVRQTFINILNYFIDSNLLHFDTYSSLFLKFLNTKLS